VFQHLSDQWHATTVHRWYTAKSTTDQRILKVLSTLSVALFFYIGLWQPLGDFADTQQQRAARSQALADWIETNRQALIQSGKQGHCERRANSSWWRADIAQITSSAAQFGITLSRLQPESDGSVSVAVEQQSFNALVQWLAGIESEQGYVIDRASIDRASEEGLVNGQFRFR
jgi:general secretion pathway protein M